MGGGEQEKVVKKKWQMPAQSETKIGTKKEKPQ